MLWPRITSEQLARIALNYNPEDLDSEATFCAVSPKNLLRLL